MDRKQINRWIQLCEENGHQTIGEPNPLGLCICQVAEGMAK